MKCKFIIESIAGKPRAFEFDQGEISLGRAVDNDIAINDKSVSRHHVNISLIQGQAEIVDLDSRNGTQLNGKKIKKAFLLDQDIFNMGNVPVQFICPEAGSESSLDQTVISSSKKDQVKKIHKILKRSK